MTARFLMIALDGADGALLDRWTADGTLPHLAALRARGSAIRLSAPEGITDDALWASFQYAPALASTVATTIVRPVGSGETVMAHRDEVDRETFWDTLSSRGARVAVLDMPKCRLPRPINGIHLADWLVHGRYFREPKSYPESLAAEVVQRFGAAPPSRCGYEGPRLSDDEVLETSANLRAAIASKRAAGFHYLASETWDLFLIAFKEAHCAGHMLWDLVDPRCADYDATRAAGWAIRFESIFRGSRRRGGRPRRRGGAGRYYCRLLDDRHRTQCHADSSHAADREPREPRARRDPAQSDDPSRGRRLSPASGKRPCELLPYNENCTALRINVGYGCARRSIATIGLRCPSKSKRSFAN